MPEKKFNLEPTWPNDAKTDPPPPWLDAPLWLWLDLNGGGPSDGGAPLPEHDDCKSWKT